MADDPYDLKRFVAAQDESGAYGRALEEMRQGQKTTHWMWFIFPQILGLGRSPMSQAFAISSLEEAREYLSHPDLGARLRQCASAVLGVSGKTAQQIFGSVDARKLRSSATLFMRADPNEPVFKAVIDRYFDSQPDPDTDRLLAALTNP